MAVDVSGLQNALIEFGSEVFLEAGSIMQEAVVEVTPRGPTGGLQEGVVFRPGAVGGVVNTGSIHSEREYSSFVDEGTSPHPIEGNPLLAFQWGGVQVIVHSVNHPGTEAQPYWSDTVTEVQWLDAVSQAIDATPLV